MVVCFKILRGGVAGDPDILRGTVGASWGGDGYIKWLFHSYGTLIELIAVSNNRKYKKVPK